MEEFNESMKEQLGRRVDIRETIEQIKNGEFISDVSDAELEQNLDLIAQQTEIQDILNRTKIERNAILAILIHEMWYESEDRIQGHKPDIELINEVANSTGHEFVDSLMLLSTQTVFDEVTRLTEKYEQELSNGQNTPMHRAYKRFAKMTDFLSRHSIDVQMGMRETITPRLKVYEGLSTATLFTWGIAKLIPVLAEQQGIEMTPEEMIWCLRNTYGTVAMFASLNVDIFDPISSKIQTPVPHNPHILNLDPAYFSLKKVDGGYKLVCDHQKMMQIMTPAGGKALEAEPFSPTTGCPALISPNEEDTNVVKSFFGWSCDLIEKHYYPTLQK